MSGQLSDARAYPPEKEAPCPLRKSWVGLTGALDGLE
jgi:hypothetical protein